MRIIRRIRVCYAPSYTIILVSFRILLRAARTSFRYLVRRMVHSRLDNLEVQHPRLFSPPALVRFLSANPPFPALRISLEVPTTAAPRRKPCQPMFTFTDAQTKENVKRLQFRDGVPDHQCNLYVVFGSSDCYRPASGNDREG